jgi:hypothetical protein
MNYVRFGAVYNAFSCSMAAYGFTRGYRSNGGGLHHKYTVPSSTPGSPSTTVYLPLLLGQRIAGGMVNGIMYALPVWNAVHLFRLFNRLEIQWHGYNPQDYPEEYHEWTGWCYDTL